MKSQERFLEWFSSKLDIGPKPTGEYKLQDEFKKYNTIINVCDFSEYSYAEEIIQLMKKYYWFPLNEIYGEIGLNSIYGALSILYQSYKNNEYVYLHCFHGKNRSRIVEASFYFMMTGEHLKQISRTHENRIFSNISRGHLPPIEKYEAFLKICEKVFTENYTETRFGPLDMCKSKLID